MESSQSSQSQLSEFIEQNDVPILKLSQFIKDQFAEKLIQNSQKSDKNAKIFTVAQTLKDPSILSYIKPDYGSLGQYIGDINMSKDLLVQKKRKNQMTEEQQEEKKIRQKLRDASNNQLNETYLNNLIPQNQRRVAGKLMIENIFKDEFGLSLQQFEAKNNKNEQMVSAQINMDRIDEIFRTDRNKQLYSNESILWNIKKVYDNNEKLKRSEKNLISKVWNRQKKLVQIEKIKNKYESLKKMKQYRKQIKNSQKQDEQSSHRNKKTQQKEQNIQIISQKLYIRNIDLKGNRIVSFFKQNDIQSIKEIKIQKIKTAQQVILFILDIITEFCCFLQNITISSISLQNSNKFSKNIKTLISKLPIKNLSLEFLELGTKQFCYICLGIAQNNTLQQLNLNNNCIDGHSYKSLQIICRHCPKLKRISLKKNYLHNFVMGKQMRQRIII